MSVYKKDKPEYLELSIISMLNQTIKSNDFVIVKDGILTAELDKVIQKYSSDEINNINVFSLNDNVGLGKALDYGLSKCQNDLVARMDADDISLPLRCEKLLNLFLLNPSLSIAGTNIDEFEDNPDKIVCSRVVPENDKEIKKFIRHRSPFNHPTVMFKKSEVIRCGGYGPLQRKQDFDLFSRMMNMGCQGYNIQESLLLFRASDDNLKRRKSKEYYRSTIYVAKLNYKRGYISFFDLAYVVIGQQLVRILPKSLLRLLIRKRIKRQKEGR